MSNQEEFTDFELEVDLSETEAWGGEQRPLVPPGDYLLTVVGFKQDTGKNSQQPYIAVTFDVAEGEHAGSKVYNNYSLSPKAQGRLKSLMLACKTELTRIVASQFVGQTIKATIVHVDGDPQVDGNGNPKPVKTFANVTNEQPLDDAPAEKAAVKAPPVTKAATNNKAAATQPRRA